MRDSEKREAAGEAQQAVSTRPAGAGTADREAAMRRYLSAEQYHEAHAADASQDDD